MESLKMFSNFELSSEMQGEIGIVMGILQSKSAINEVIEQNIKKHLLYLSQPIAHKLLLLLPEPIQYLLGNRLSGIISEAMTPTQNGFMFGSTSIFGLAESAISEKGYRIADFVEEINKAWKQSGIELATIHHYGVNSGNATKFIINLCQPK